MSTITQMLLEQIQKVGIDENDARHKLIFVLYYDVSVYPTTKMYDPVSGSSVNIP